MQFEDCTIIRKKVKNARISIKNTGEVIITVPRLCLPFYARSLFESKKSWIENKLNNINKNKVHIEKHYGKIQYLGDFYDFQLDEKLKKDIINVDEKIIFSHNDLASKINLETWYKKTAKKYLTKRLEEIVKKEGFKIGKISVRSQKTRWGSCSGKNNISLNWRLIKCPIHIIDYVLYHELTHTIEKNHSTKFWLKLESHFTDYKEARKRLKKNGGVMFM